MFDQQAAEVGGQVFIDDEAHVGLLQGDAVDAQAIGLVVDAAEVQTLPFQQVALAGAVDNVQLVDMGVATNADVQWLQAFELYLQLAAEQAAAQLDAHQRFNVGARQLQVQVAGVDLQVGRERRQCNVAAGL